MDAKSADWPPPVIESFTVEKLDQPEEGEGSGPLAQVKLVGRNFFVRAIAPEITIGEEQVLDYEIKDSEQMIVLYLYERPPEGKITVSYGPGLTAETEQSLVLE
jgi:hypothetical protein